MDFKKRLYEYKTTVIQAKIRSYLARKRFKTVMYGVVKIQGHFRRRKAKAELKRLKVCRTFSLKKKAMVT